MYLRRGIILVEMENGNHNVRERNMNDDERYDIAFVCDDGSFDVVDNVHAATDDEANDYAEAEYAGQDWYVLLDGRNINA